MANLHPFYAIRYSESAGSLEELITTFHEAPCQIDRDYLTNNNPYNIANLSLPVKLSEDRSQFVCYARSAALLQEWLSEKKLEIEKKPAFYRYTQKFNIEGFPEKFERTSLIGLMEIESFPSNIIHPHEEVFPKYCKDRLRLLEATQTHFENILCLYEDKAYKGHTWIKSLESKETLSCITPDKMEHIVDKIQDTIYFRAILEFFRTKRLMIADGHHRYQASLMFHELYPKIKGSKYIPVALTSVHDPGIYLQSFHRVIKNFNVNLENLMSKLIHYYDMHEIDKSKVRDFMKNEESNKHIAYIMGYKDRFWTLSPHNIKEIIEEFMPDAEPNLSKLNICILHNFIFTELLKISPLKNLYFTKKIDEAVSLSEEHLTFIYKSPTLKSVMNIAFSGSTMPQKSTFFYPKIPGGFLMWNMSHFTE